MKQCPCHSEKSYDTCCQPFHDGALPQNALQLMRSRYAAYALQLADYIMDSTHKDNAGWKQNRKEWAKQILDFCTSTQFEGLEILEFQDGPHLAYVTFTAKLKQQGRNASFTEKSRFDKVDNRWLYHSGSIKN